MIRILLLNMALLAAPFIVYFLYARWARARADEDPLADVEPPWAWLGICGLTLVATALIGFGLLGGGDPDATYQPSRYEGGEITPAELK